MTWWMWLLGSLTVYGVGWYRFAIAEAQRLNDKEAAKNAEWRGLYGRARTVDRRWNMSEAMFVATLWPFMLPLRRLAEHLDEQAGPTRTELTAENEQLQADIARLEREAGL